MFGDKLKKFLNKSVEENKKGNNKKKIENLIFFIVIAIVTIIAINIIWNGNKTTNKNETNNTTKQLAQTTNTVDNKIDVQTDLEKKLETILSQIQGVGNVKVLINYSESSEVIAMYNESSKVSNTEEKDSTGGTRKIEQTDLQKDIIYKEENGEKIPITQKVLNPKIEGAIITAKGANNSNIKSNIIQAVEAVTGLSVHKIQVFEMN